MVEEEFKIGYQQGFADGYKAAMKEIFDQREAQIKRVQEDIETPGVDPRWRFWPW